MECARRKIGRREFLKWVGAGGVLTAGSLAARVFGGGFLSGGRSVKKKPNFVFILADDLGFSQLGCYGSGFYETPNLDRLAGEGMRFTDAYAACPVCSPTRASIMTGKYPARLHITDFIPGGEPRDRKFLTPKWQKYLSLEEVTVAELMKQAGYTTASFGKWHLSIAKKPPKSLGYNPDKQGFDESIVTQKPGPKDDPEGDTHNVKKITERALKFLDENRNRSFFLYVTHNTIHSPDLGKSRLVSKYKDKPGAEKNENNPTLAAMIQELDESTGRLLRKLDELKIADNTIVVFFSDNGGLKRSAHQTPLHGGKGMLYEGGIRVPLIVRWPGIVKAGGICSEPVTSVDFFPTFAEILGIKPETNGPIDGVSILPLLKQKCGLDRGAIYWHYPHYHSAGVGPSGTVRAGDYKLIEWYDDSIKGAENKFELYNLKEDISEKNNLAKVMPAKVNELKKLFSDWRRRVGAQQMPLNPDFKQ